MGAVDTETKLLFVTGCTVCLMLSCTFPCVYENSSLIGVIVLGITAKAEVCKGLLIDNSPHFASQTILQTHW